MANYTTTKLRLQNRKGSSIFSNNMRATSGEIIISPEGGYVVSASDFSLYSIPSTLDSVTFTDVTTAGSIGNTVKLTITLASTFVADKNIKIPLRIKGDAKKWQPDKINVNVGVTIIDDRNKSSNGTLLSCNTPLLLRMFTGF